MDYENPHAVPKVHPATREVLPEDPMDLRGFEVPGDPELMMRMLIEDYARMGWDADAIMRLAQDPNYLAFHGLLRMLGEDGLRRRVADTISRCGVMRVTSTEREPEQPQQELMQIDLPADS
ncbi:MAG: hypothetical protein QF805_25865 [Pirellulaceae bacterium]|jgi:hypothetical protein|nr:hypothetical protein [Pirellulaceae bacterium]